MGEGAPLTWVQRKKGRGEVVYERPNDIPATPGTSAEAESGVQDLPTDQA